jgi:DNA-binding response OmpR family regulator
MQTEYRPIVLVVEDTPAHAQIIRASLGDGYDTIVAGTMAEALNTLAVRLVDVVLLDIMLPDGDGYQLCSLLRDQRHTRDIPVLFLSGRADTTDKVMGFSLGADDYITKPVAPQELKARVDAKLRRLRSSLNLSLPGMEFDFALQTVKIDSSKGWQELELTPREYKLLAFFARNRETALSREQILKAVWGDHTHVTDRSIDTHVASLRKKLGPLAHCIKSVHRTGYSFVVDLTLCLKRAD